MAAVTGQWWVDTLLLAATVLYLLYWYLNGFTTYFKDRGIPFLTPPPILGDLDVIRKPQTELAMRLYNSFPKEKFFGYFQFRSPTLVVKDPELIQKVMVKDFANFHDRGFPVIENDPMNQNLFALKGQRWRILRQKLIPTFSTGKLRNMFEQINKCGDNILENVDKLAVSGEAVDARNFIMNYPAEVIGSTAFGLNLSKDSPQGIEFLQMVKRAFMNNTYQFIVFFLANAVPNIVNSLKIRSSPQAIIDYFTNLTTATKKYRKDNDIKRKDYFQLLLSLQEEEESGKSLLPAAATDNEEDALINQMDYVPQYSQQDHSNKKLFTDQGIMAQTFIFLIAGTESVTTTLSFVLFHVATDPSIQQKLKEEIKMSLAKHGGWTYQALKEMTYLDQVIQETQRLYPVVSMLMRECTIPFTIPDTNITIDKGTYVNIPILGLQKDPKYYPNPEVFDPDRFADNNYKPNPTYMPWGDGPRICIAMRFAILEMKVLLAKLLSKYSVELDEKKTKVPFVFDKKSFFPRPIDGIWVNFKKDA